MPRCLRQRLQPQAQAEHSQSRASRVGGSQGRPPGPAGPAPPPRVPCISPTAWALVSPFTVFAVIVKANLKIVTVILRFFTIFFFMEH